MADLEKETRPSHGQEKNSLNSETPAVTLIHKVAGFVGAGFLHLVGKTSFVFAVDHPAFLAFRREKKPVIYAFWHNAQVFLAYAHRGEHANIMVSQSKDGEYIAQVMKCMGLDAVRGSTSRGAAEALRGMIDLIKAGRQVGFTPDGPRGPLHTVHGGVVMAAQSTGVPIVPVTYTTNRKITFRSWDKFVMPLPFASMVVVHGKPFILDPNVSEMEAKEKVRQAINIVGDEADQRLRELPPWLVSLAGHGFSLLYSLLKLIITPCTMPFLIFRYGHKNTFRFLKERLKANVPPLESGRRIWLHAASVGEWQALKPILAELKTVPDLKFVITVSASSARMLVAREEPNAIVRMLPIDFTWILKSFIRQVNPFAVGVIETELWPKMLVTLHKSFVPVILLNGRIAGRSAAVWIALKPYAQRILSCFSYLFVRTELDGRRFVQMGVPVSRVMVTGNSKVDNLNLIMPTPENRRERALKSQRLFGDSGGVVIVGASTWPGEETALLKLFQEKSSGRIRLMIAPRKLQRVEEVAGMIEKVAASWSRWSKVKETHLWDTDILLVDTLGDLKELVALADIAFVGGSLIPHGGQSPLEPAAAGVPVLFGTSMENFHEEANDLKKLGAAREARNETDLLADIRELIANESTRLNMGLAAARYVESKMGASHKTVSAIEEMFKI